MVSEVRGCFNQNSVRWQLNRCIQLTIAIVMSFAVNVSSMRRHARQPFRGIDQKGGISFFKVRLCQLLISLPINTVQVCDNRIKFLVTLLIETNFSFAPAYQIYLCVVHGKIFYWVSLLLFLFLFQNLLLSLLLFWARLLRVNSLLRCKLLLTFSLKIRILHFLQLYQVTLVFPTLFLSNILTEDLKRIK